MCGQWADSKGYHALSCRKALGRLSRLTTLNIIVKRGLAAVGIFSDLLPQGLILSDGRRPDGVTIAPVDAGKLVTWDVTCVCTLAIANVAASSSKAGGAADIAEVEKTAKY